MTDEESHLIVDDIPPEWRICTESIVVPQKPLPHHKFESVPEPPNLSNIIENDLSKMPNYNSTIELLLEFAQDLQNQMKGCRKTLKSAELKRREIASSAELLNGICNSQITEEQRLTVFVSGIDKFISFYENLDRIYIDFKSPGFTVFSPDFPSDIHKINDGIKFFEANSNFRDSRSFRLRYTSLQNRATELVSNYVTTALNRAVILSANSDSYQKFQTIAPPIKRLFKMIEGLPRHFDALNVYRKIRVQIIKPQMKFVSLESALFSALNFIEKEYNLATLFFNFEKETYKSCFINLAVDIADCFSMLYIHELYGTRDILQLCQFCSVFRSQRLLAEISKLSLVSNEIDRKISSILRTTQERIIEEISLISNEVAISQEVVRYIILLYNSLSRDQFCEPAYRLVSDSMNYIDQKGKDIEGGEIERNVFLLKEFYTLKQEIDSIGRELDGDVIEFWNLLHSEKGSHSMLMKRLESSITLRYQSLGSAITQFIMNPLFNLKARNIFGKIQVMSAIEGVSVAIDVHYVHEILPQLQKYITEGDEKERLMNELKEQLILALGESISYFPDIDDETNKAISNIRTKILAISI